MITALLHGGIGGIGGREAEDRRRHSRQARSAAGQVARDRVTPEVVSPLSAGYTAARRERVALLQTAIEAGAYFVSATQIADCLMESMLEDV